MRPIGLVAVPPTGEPTMCGLLSSDVVDSKTTPELATVLAPVPCVSNWYHLGVGNAPCAIVWMLSSASPIWVLLFWKRPVGGPSVLVDPGWRMSGPAVTDGTVTLACSATVAPLRPRLVARNSFTVVALKKLIR